MIPTLAPNYPNMVQLRTRRDHKGSSWSRDGARLVKQRSNNGHTWSNNGPNSGPNYPNMVQHGRTLVQTGHKGSPWTRHGAAPGTRFSNNGHTWSNNDPNAGPKLSKHCPTWSNTGPDGTTKVHRGPEMVQAWSNSTQGFNRHSPRFQVAHSWQ